MIKAGTKAPALKRVSVTVEPNEWRCSSSAAPRAGTSSS